MKAKPWNDVSIDMMTGLPNSKGKDAILVVVCRFTKMAKIIPFKTTFKAIDVARLYVAHVMSDHGLPKTIVSDRDSRFLSDFWQELMKILEVDVKLSSSYHPQTDG